MAAKQPLIIDVYDGEIHIKSVSAYTVEQINDTMILTKRPDGSNVDEQIATQKQSYEQIATQSYEQIDTQKQSYWRGPYGCLVPDSFDSCVAADGCNKQRKYGGQTEKHVMRTKPFTKEDWLNKYAELRDDHMYIYVGDKDAIKNNVDEPIATQSYEQIDTQKQSYWRGPYDCLVPDSVDSCVAADGGNILYKDGSETEMDVEPTMSKEEWIATYTYKCTGLHGLRYYKNE